jgi:hypothetical protein
VDSFSSRARVSLVCLLCGGDAFIVRNILYLMEPAEILRTELIISWLNETCQ